MCTSPEKARRYNNIGVSKIVFGYSTRFFPNLQQKKETSPLTAGAMDTL